MQWSSEILAHLEKFPETTSTIHALKELVRSLAVQGLLRAPNSGSIVGLEVVSACSNASDDVPGRKRRRSKNKPLPLIDQSSTPWSVPDQWAWGRLGAVTHFVDYRGKTPPKTAEGIRLITAKNVRLGFIQLEPEEFVSEATYEAWMTRGFPKKGDVLFTTEAPLGNVAQIDFSERFALAQRVILLRPRHETLDPAYLRLALLSQPVRKLIVEQATGMTAKGIKAARLKLIPIPIPPPRIQRHLVKTVSSIVKKCNELEARQEQQRQARTRLNESCLAHLLAAQTPAEFAEHWQRIHDNFDLLFQDLDDLKRLSSVVSFAACCGRMMPHDPNNSTTTLLDEIRQRHRERWEQSKLTRFSEQGKKPKNDRWKAKYKEPPRAPDVDKPWLSQSWRWATIEELACKVVDCPHTTPKWTEGGVICVRTTEFKPGFLNLSSARYVSEETYEERIRRLRPEPGDILFSREGGILGVACLIPEKTRLCLGQRMMLIRVDEAMNPSYVMHVLNSPIVQETVRTMTTGSASPHLNVRDVKRFAIPVPPRTIQDSIVAQISSLQTTLGALGESIVKQEKTGAALLSALVQSATTLPAEQDVAVTLNDSNQPRPNEVGQQTVLPFTAPVPLAPETILEHTFPALWGLGPLDRDTAVRTVAAHLREAGLCHYKRLRKDGPLYAQVLAGIEKTVKAGDLDRPKRGHVRAIEPDASEYEPDDWRMALLAVLGSEPMERAEAIRAAAEWAREHCGLQFQRLPRNGHIVKGLRSAINSAIRRGLVIREGTTHIRRAPA